MKGFCTHLACLSHGRFLVKKKVFFFVIALSAHMFSSFVSHIRSVPCNLAVDSQVLIITAFFSLLVCVKNNNYFSEKIK